MLIAFEGIDGCGKSLQAKLFSEWLTSCSVKNILTREPGGTRAPEFRELCLFNEKISPKARLLLFLADRLQHLEEVIIPALSDGLVVVTDRYIDSTSVYQALVGNDLSWQEVDEFQRFLFDILISHKPCKPLVNLRFRPHLTFLIDVPALVALKRLSGKIPDIFEAPGSTETVSLFETRRFRYKQIQKEHSDTVFLVDGEKSVKAVADKVRSLYESFSSGPSCVRANLQRP